MRLKAVIIGDPDHRHCAYRIEEALLSEGCAAVWNSARMPKGFSTLTRILSNLPALFVCDVVVVMPSFKSRWSSYFEVMLAKLLVKIIVPAEHVIPVVDDVSDETYVFSKEEMAKQW